MKKTGYFKKVVHTLTAAALVATMTLGISISVSAAEYDLGNLKRTRTYQANFDDLVDKDGKAYWGEQYIKDAYEYGIVNGKGGSKFDPNGTLTGAEAITIGARIHAFYKYGFDADAKIDAAGKMQWPPLKDVNGKETIAANFSRLYPSSTAWYDKYVKYVMFERLMEYGTPKGGITKGGKTFMDIIEEPVTRRNMVALWSKLLKSEDMAVINDIVGIPDITREEEFASQILQFYNAGIIRGVDSLGTFRPNSNITRMECAAIFMNLVDPSRRTSGLKLTSSDSYMVGDVPFSPSLDIETTRVGVAVDMYRDEEMLTTEAAQRFMEDMLIKSKGFYDIDMANDSFKFDFTLPPLPDGYIWRFYVSYLNGTKTGVWRSDDPTPNRPGIQGNKFSGEVTAPLDLKELYLTIGIDSLEVNRSKGSAMAIYDLLKNERSYIGNSPAHWLDLIFPEDCK